MTPALTFTTAFAALSAGHWLADYWTQTNTQAMRKGLPGWPGRRAPLRRLACLLGKESYWHAGGAADLDQAWHWCWLFAAALIIAA